MSRPTTGSLLIAGCATTWGIVGIIVREVDAPAMTIVFFRVALAATKREVKVAVESLFSVKVKAVNTIRVQGKMKRTRGRVGYSSD